jgi:hypothetical protein
MTMFHHGSRCAAISALALFFVTVPGPAAQAGNGPNEVKGDGTASINITFFPKRSAYAKDCTEIEHIQFVQTWARYVDKNVLVKPGQIRKRDAWLDATLSSKGHCVDTLNSTEPIYQIPGHTPGNTREGTKAALTDEPAIWSSDLPPYNAKAAPDGWAGMTWNFNTFAYCNAGNERGKFYEGVYWEWETFANRVSQTDGRGTVKVKDTNVPPPAPGSVFHEALEKYVKEKAKQQQKR